MIDLHSHSDVSDGSESPERVVELAADAGCSTVALTDHDTTGGLDRAGARAASLGIRLVPGCEVSCAYEPGTMHVLCYFVPTSGGLLQEELARLRDDRDRRNEEMARTLAHLGLPVTYEEVVAEAGGLGVGRPHFASVLVRKGVVSSVEEAFGSYLGKGAPGYVSKARVEVASVVDLARRSGAVAVLAHPLSLGLSPAGLEPELRRLAELGLAGVECHYGRYDPATRADLAAAARRCGLVATGGSDFHGSYKPDLSVGTGTGDLAVPDEVVAELESLRPAAHRG
ncbi:MAG: PHP domain-containing protein [Actinomycetota bacterium]|nr:PHP domain-containing protein [Actinomycetota bacterium]